MRSPNPTLGAAINTPYCVYIGVACRSLLERVRGVVCLEECGSRMGGRDILAVWVSISPQSHFTLSNVLSRDGVPPHATALLPPFSSYQPYDVSLHLVVPASQNNYELGNFMTTLTLSTLSNRTIITTRKPVSTCTFTVDVFWLTAF